ncbi:hypothetical protein HAX54_004784 [Datura stramonium]|uniref:Uncharacterized protein n=1 Tax=Datura stramonium TaxID=4076 RepID=A0ABS8T8S3_DATST|nr:hypothetical protein [Datura stramonium]
MEFEIWRSYRLPLGPRSSWTWMLYVRVCKVSALVSLFDGVVSPLKGGLWSSILITLMDDEEAKSIMQVGCSVVFPDLLVELSYGWLLHEEKNAVIFMSKIVGSKLPHLLYSSSDWSKYVLSDGLSRPSVQDSWLSPAVASFFKFISYFSQGSGLRCNDALSMLLMVMMIWTAAAEGLLIVFQPSFMKKIAVQSESTNFFLISLDCEFTSKEIASERGGYFHVFHCFP